MKQNWNRILVVALILITLVLVAGCSSTKNPYDANNAKNYTVSVKYDANGGVFTTNTTVIVDSFNLKEISDATEGDLRCY